MTLLMRDKEQQKIGKYTDKVEVIRNKRNNVSKDILIDIFDLDSNDYDKIVYLIDKNPEWKDEEIAEAVINGQNE